MSTGRENLIAPNSNEARDIAFFLHPNTDPKKHALVGPLIIEKGDGIYVIDASGKRYIESVSGLWSVGVGFSEQRLVDAATRQMEKLPFYQTFHHKSFDAIIDLSEKLVTMAPGGMSKAFFTNSGSEAVDTVLKFLWYRSNAMGQPLRKKVITRHGAYHGTTIAASSLTGLALSHKTFDLIVPGVIRLTSPKFYSEARTGESEVEFTARLVDELERKILEEGPDTICAFIGEPVIGAGGVIVPPQGYWKGVQAVLRKYDILLVVDEVICGFGRTGNMFGCDTYEITPDVLVLSKQLSSSYQPIAAVLMNDKFIGPIVEEGGRLGTLAHGYTAGGHPVAAAVALENIAIIEERGLAANAAKVGRHLQERLEAMRGHALIGDIRGVGLIAGVELAVVENAELGSIPKGRLGYLTEKALLENGVISRAIGDTIAFCPPMIITVDQIDDLVRRFEKSLNEVQLALSSGAA